MGQQRVVTGLRLAGVVVLAVAATVIGLGSAWAAPRGGPDAVRQLVAAAAHQSADRHAAGTSRHPLRVPGAKDSDTYLGVDPGCAPAGGKAKPGASVYSPTKVKLDYVLTGPGLDRTGTVKVKAHRVTSLKLKAVKAGSYRLTLALHGTATQVGDASFDVLPCVRVTRSCRAVTFTNPAGNPAAYVTYQGHKKRAQFELDLAPGASSTVRADYARIDYVALTSDDGYALGKGSVKVKQHCKHGAALPGTNAVQTQAITTCSAGSPGTLTLGWTAQPSVEAARYEVLDSAQRVVASGSFTSGHEADVPLAAGSYTYRSYANGLTQPFEEVAFDVLLCVQVTPQCRSFDVHNPNAVPLAVIPVSIDDDDDDPGEDEESSPVTVGADATVSIPWLHHGVWVLAVPEAALHSPQPFLAIGSELPADDEETGTEIPQDC